jgi:hypothetical protein
MKKEEEQATFIRKMFGKFLKGRTVNVIDDLQKEEPKEKECGYIIFDLFQNDTFESVLSNLLDYSQDKKFFIDDIYGTIVILYLRKDCFFKENENMEPYLKDFIANIPENILKNIRFIYGIENAKVGVFGSNDIWVSTILLNNYFEKILKLANLKYGENMEIKNDF